MARAVSGANIVFPVVADIYLGLALAINVHLIPKKPRRIKREFFYQISDQVRFACRQNLITFPALNLISNLGFVPADQGTKILPVKQQIASRQRAPHISSEEDPQARTPSRSEE